MRLILLLSVCGLLLGQDAREIVKRSLEREERNFALLNTYLYEERTITKQFDKNGTVKETEDKTSEVFYVDGSRLERLVAKNGKALSAAEAEKEQKRIDKEIEKIGKESPSARAKRRGESEKDKKEEIEFRRQVLDGFDFVLHGEETRNGRACWKIEGKPKAGYKPRGKRADWLSKMQGLMWIDKESSEWSAMEVDSLDTISFGWFLVRLQAGAKVKVSQALVNGEIWLPKSVEIRADARILGKMVRLSVDSRYDKFRKFSSDSQLIVGPPSQPTPEPIP